ncbi:MAG TPA: carboxypeptidase regulatory-like domain-containing protein [Stenomitos sp.]
MAWLLGPALLGLASGCDLLSGVPAGVVVGDVRFDGRPAPGITVALQTYSSDRWTSYTVNGTAATATTDASGQYRFERLKAGQYRVRFDLAPSVVMVGGTQLGPKEVATWTTKDVSIGGGGARIAAFDVAYDGLIYPESGKSNTYSERVPLPFHWHTHREADHYKVKIYDKSGGATNPKLVWESDWTTTPVTSLSKATQPGNYQWEVELDAGNGGTGTSERRNLDLDFQGATPEPSPEPS